MILQALTDYYDILRQSGADDIPARWYSREKISYCLVLSDSGDLIHIISLLELVQRGKKEMEVPQVMIVPERIQRSGTKPNANFLYDNLKFTLGIENAQTKKTQRKYFEKFKELHQTILKNVSCPEAKAFLLFLDKWQPEQAFNHPILQPFLENPLFLKANLVFQLDGGDYLHENQEICRAWEEYKQKNQSAVLGQCLITGKENVPIAKLNPQTRGIRGGQTTGCSLVSFNEPAYLSYGKEQGENAPISEAAAFQYGTVLNYLVADQKHKLYLGDTTVVYWAHSVQKAYQDVAALLFDPDELEAEQPEAGTMIYDPHAVKLVRAVMEQVAAGLPITTIPELDPATQFYVLGLAPNAARLSVRFFVQNRFDVFVAKLAKHYQDLQIERQRAADREFLPLWLLLRQTVSEKVRDKACSPLLAGAVLRAILTGLAYPATLFSNVMLRLKAGDDINYARAAIIKAYLIRRNIDTEVLTMSLNVQTENVAYQLGRLFAVLEKLQEDANGSSNIRERYFSACSATPAVVLPILLRLAQHHIAKSDYGAASDRRIAQILEKIDLEKNPIPKNLSLEEQGVFVLGYYHQRNDLYRKKEDRIWE